MTPNATALNRSTLKGVWGALERSIADENDVEAGRISVFGGPIFEQDDVPFRDALVPRDFWKVVAYVEADVLKAKAFILTQKDLEDRLEELILEEYRMYQRRVDELATKLELDFGDLTTADTAPTTGRPEIVATPMVRRIESISEINVPGW